MQNICIIWNAGVGHASKNIRVCILEMSGSGGSRNGAEQKRRCIYVCCTTVAENSVTKAEF